MEMSLLTKLTFTLTKKTCEENMSGKNWIYAESNMKHLRTCSKNMVIFTILPINRNFPHGFSWSERCF